VECHGKAQKHFESLFKPLFANQHGLLLQNMLFEQTLQVFKDLHQDFVPLIVVQNLFLLCTTT